MVRPALCCLSFCPTFSERSRSLTIIHLLQNLAKEIALNELQHVLDLRQALGAAATPCPQVDLGAAFATAADAAAALANTSFTPKYSPYANDLSFWLASYLFEDVGVSAYQGKFTTFVLDCWHVWLGSLWLLNCSRAKGLAACACLPDQGWWVGEMTYAGLIHAHPCNFTLNSLQLLCSADSLGLSRYMRGN